MFSQVFRSNLQLIEGKEKKPPGGDCHHGGRWREGRVLMRVNNRQCGFPKRRRRGVGVWGWVGAMWVSKEEEERGWITDL